MQGDAPADERGVDDGVARGEPVEEQHVRAVEDAELRVLTHARVQRLQVRARELPQPQGAGRTAGHLPEPHAEAVGAIGEPLDEPFALELGDEPVRGGSREPRARRDVGERQERIGGVEGLHHPQVLAEHGLAAGCARHQVLPGRGIVAPASGKRIRRFR